MLTLPALKRLAKQVYGRPSSVRAWKASPDNWCVGVYVEGQATRLEFCGIKSRPLAFGAAEAALLELLNDPVQGGSPVDAIMQRDQLWELLDDIDTLDDSCREHDGEFRKRVRAVQKKRWAIYRPSGT